MYYQILLRLCLGLLLANCADEPTPEEPVQTSPDDQNAADQNESEEQEDSALDSYGDQAGGAEDFEEGSEAGAAPMVQSDENGGGIISGGVMPQPESDDGNIMLDCEQTSIPAKPGHVTYGCYAKTANGQRASRIRGEWRPYSNAGSRIPMRDLVFANKGYDVTFEVTAGDASKGFTMKRQ